MTLRGETVAVTECDQLLNRLRRADGQLRAVIALIEAERDCLEVATQLSAARSAMDKASMLLVLRVTELSKSGKLSMEEVQKIALIVA